MTQGLRIVYAINYQNNMEIKSNGSGLRVLQPGAVEQEFSYLGQLSIMLMRCIAAASLID